MARFHEVRRDSSSRTICHTYIDRSDAGLLLLPSRLFTDHRLLPSSDYRRWVRGQGGSLQGAAPSSTPLPGIAVQLFRDRYGGRHLRVHRGRGQSDPPCLLQEGRTLLIKADPARTSSRDLRGTTAIYPSRSTCMAAIRLWSASDGGGTPLLGSIRISARHRN
jgi:hypothetical protein